MRPTLTSRLLAPLVGVVLLAAVFVAGASVHLHLLEIPALGLFNLVLWVVQLCVGAFVLMLVSMVVAAVLARWLAGGK